MLPLFRRSIARSITFITFLALWGCGDTEMERPDASTNTCVPNAAECATRGFNCGRVDMPDDTCITCGICTNGTETCGGAGQANVCGCTPRSCEALGVQCGTHDNMCGSTVECGVCLGGAACVNGQCQAILGLEDSCRLTPTACDVGLTCCDVGSDSVCLTADASGNCPAPAADIVLDREVTARSLSFETLAFQPTSCAISDGCIPGPGTYELLRFATQINNVGLRAMAAGTPSRDPEFVYDQCHMHYHFDGFVNYSLREALPNGEAGAVVAGGSKFSYCIEDVTRVDPNLPGSPENATYQCGAGDQPQGLSVGWGDLYEAELDCQWVDITGVSPGSYLLELTANPDRKLPESRFNNNTLLIPVQIP